MAPAQDVWISVISTDLEEAIIRAVPLIQDFLNDVRVLTHLEAHQPLIAFEPGITLNADLHTSHYCQSALNAAINTIGRGADARFHASALHFFSYYRWPCLGDFNPILKWTLPDGAGTLKGLGASGHLTFHRP